jgi:hypothetical protein
MGISETIIAAIIGALATMGTAIFQLVRNRAPSDGRPKPKKSRTRSVLATIALMIGCIVGGYAWSALRSVSAKEELQATMQAEFTRQFTEFAALQSQQNAKSENDAKAPGAALPARNGESGASESFANLPPCRINTQPEEVGPVSCTEQVAHPIALCAAIPAGAETGNVRVQARVPKSEAPWEERDSGATSLGSLRMGAATSEFPVNPEQKSVRLIVEYAFPNSPAGELTASAPTGTSL